MPSEIVLGAGLKLLSDLLKDKLSGMMSREKSQGPNLEASLGNHLSQIASWSSRIQIYGMSKALDTDSATLPLTFDATPRRFRGLGKPESRAEVDLIDDNEHLLLLGDPGSGKTTTLQRLSRMLLSDSGAAGGDAFQFPIVIRLRELDRSASLHEEIIKIFGLIPHHQEETSEINGKVVKKQICRVGSTDILIAVPSVLNESRALVLLDGLDEIEGTLRRRIEGELKSLALSLTSSKLIVTCRSGDYSYMIEGFSVVELCPLTWEQISQIANMWLPGEAEAFISALRSLPYNDLADRPLLLAQLLMIFKRQGYLPEQPSEIYRRIVRLLLEEWDSQRRIRRGSQYSRFSPDRKLHFLSTLAYRLTYKVKTKVFSEKDLIEAYHVMHQRFGLPQQEAERVAHEIESHTGIIIAGAADKYEFSHLSIQEFLCAEYLVRDAFPRHLSDYARSYPAPIAVAVAISSDPSNWMGGLFLRSSPSCGHFTEASLSAFLSRLLMERPYFEASPVLGYVLLRMLSDFSLSENLLAFATSDLVTECLGTAIGQYEAVSYKDQRIKLRLRPSYRNRSDTPAPHDAVLPVEILRRVITKRAGTLFCDSRISSSWTISDEEGINRLSTLPSI